MSHVEGAGDQLVGHEPARPERRRGGGERANPQGVEEVGHEPQRELKHAGALYRSGGDRTASRRHRHTVSAIAALRQDDTTARQSRHGDSAGKFA